MKWFNTLATVIMVSCLFSTAVATDLNGRIRLVNNDGTNYKIILQINIDSEPQELGGATVVIDYDNTIVSYPNEPEMGVDFIFYNFNMGFYDTASVTKVTESQIWINVDLIADGFGTIVAGGPYLWTDLVLLNFVSNGIVTKKVVFWDIYSSYWGVYDSDNATMWGIGNFDDITTSNENEIVNDQINSYNLSQNYPNPFNPSTKIKYAIPFGTLRGEEYVPITLKVYDILGNEVATLVDEEKEPGIYEIEFSSSSGAINLVSGVYFYRLQAGDFTDTKKMILLR